MFDHFTILSGNVSFAHRREQEYPDDPPNWIGKEQQFTQGTAVWIDLARGV
jgi:hypothetical protein